MYYAPVPLIFAPKKAFSIFARRYDDCMAQEIFFRTEYVLTAAHMTVTNPRTPR